MVRYSITEKEKESLLMYVMNCRAPIDATNAQSIDVMNFLMGLKSIQKKEDSINEEVKDNAVVGSIS